MTRRELNYFIFLFTGFQYFIKNLEEEREIQCFGNLRWQP
jgi:hypothetical protein